MKFNKAADGRWQGMLSVPQQGMEFKMDKLLVTEVQIPFALVKPEAGSFRCLAASLTISRPEGCSRDVESAHSTPSTRPTGSIMTFLFIPYLRL